MQKLTRQAIVENGKLVLDVPPELNGHLLRAELTEESEVSLSLEERLKLLDELAGCMSSGSPVPVPDVYSSREYIYDDDGR